MRLLAIDASTKSSGFALFEDSKLLEYGCWTASSTDLIKRIHTIINSLDNFLLKNKINKIILEEVRPEEKGSTNSNTYKALMYLQAEIAILIHDKYNNIKIEYVYPSEWRKECGIKTGSGIRRDELKKKDIEFVKKEYNIEVNDDIADAIGIGHFYFNKTVNEINWE